MTGPGSDAVPDAGEAAAPADERPRQADERPQFERRASNVLLLTGALGVLAGLLAFLMTDAAPAVVRGIVGVVAIAAGLASFALSVALDRRRTWAPPVAATGLWLIVIGGVARLVVGFSAATISIPLDVLLAGWALSGAGRPSAGLGRGGRPLVAALLAASILGQLAGPAATILATPGISPWIVDRSALDGGLRVSCVPDAGGSTPGLEVRVSWTWARRDAFPDGEDAVGVAWAVEAPGTPLPMIDPAAAQPAQPGISAGGGGASWSLARGELAGFDIVARWLVDVGGHGQNDGAVSLRLTEPPGLGTSAEAGVHLRAVYAHAGRWTVSTEASCGGSSAQGPALAVVAGG